MDLTRYDIGAEIISILTKGMYRDPRDAVREYIQNSVDAHSKDIEVKVRPNSIIVQDYGIGMNWDILRAAVRLGISDKNPAKNVGFMGIGIYSAFHLCDRLDIYSIGTKEIPNKLSMDFSKMRTELETQRDLRLNGKIESGALIDLQTLLEDCIELTKDGELGKDVYSKSGTRVELIGIDPVFSSVLSDFDELANYLRDVIPLKFDRENFTHAAEIEAKIEEVCIKHDALFELTNLNLQVGSKQENLYRPYKDSDFNAKVKPQEPTILEIKRGNMFFGVAWGCLNQVRKIVDTKSLRGFILKKQGFSVGNRDSLVKYFPKGHSYYDRTIGEVIITNPNLLPNASRTDLEVSEYRTKFYDALKNVAEEFDEIAEQYQEWTKSDEELAKIADELKKLNVQFDRTGEDSDELISILVDVKAQADKIAKRLKRKGSMRPESLSIATQIKEQSGNLEKSIQEKINNIINHRKTSKANKAKSITIGKHLTALQLPKPEEKKYENLTEVLDDLDIDLSDEKNKTVFEILDERFVQPKSETRSQYYQLLNALKAEIQSRLESI
jgi:hypothetical protein